RIGYLNYKMIALDPTPIDNDTRNGLVADRLLIRRRRSLYDLRLQDVREIEVFKESFALIIKSQLPPEQREAIDHAYRNYPLAYIEDNNSDVAMIGAQIFEEAIVAPAGTTTTLIPIDTAYIASMLRRARKRKAA
ncbi:MAG TPA: hypothetical protein VFH39_00535, partial [Candidatus Saccharimonadales bacterium]|nr:hypothetical protein [Candidatus Saccharimonadales bacterium]